MMESIDDLLSEVKAEYLDEAQPLELKKQQPLNQLLPVAPAYQPEAWQKNVAYSAEESIISQLKAEFEEQERAEQLKKEEQLREEQLREEQKLQQQREALRSKAEAWLKDITPDSAEGLWFEEFAYQYPSKLEAAIDYLQALQGTQP